MADNDAMVAALLREREGYVRFDKADRVAAVDAALKALGYEDESAAPKARTARKPRQSTAD